MIRSPFAAVAKARVALPFPRKEMGSDSINAKNYPADSDEEDEIVSLQFDNLSSCSDSEQEDAHQRSGDQHTSASSMSSSVSSFHSSSSRFMDSMRNIKILPRMKPTLEKYNELPDESGGNSSAELALELDKIAMNSPYKASDICEVEPADPHLLSKLEEAMGLDSNDYSIVLDHQGADCDQLNLSPLSTGRQVVDLPPITPARRSSRTAKLVPKDRTPQTPRRGTTPRRRHPSSSRATRKSIKTISDLRLHKSVPGNLDYKPEDTAQVSPRRSSHNYVRSRQHRTNNVSPRRRFRRNQPKTSPAAPSRNIVAAAAVTTSRNRRRMSLMAAPDLNASGNLSHDHLQRSQLFINRPEGTLQRSISTDSTDLGRIAGTSKSSLPSSHSSSIGKLKVVGKQSKRERTKFDFDPKSLKDVMPMVDKHTAVAAATSASPDKRKVKVQPLVAYQNQPFVEL